jgi:hypothetical protein
MVLAAIAIIAGIMYPEPPALLVLFAVVILGYRTK